MSVDRSSQESAEAPESRTQPAGAAGEVHVWRISAARLLAAGRLDALERMLSPEEQLRAGKLLREPARAEFICGRAALRVLLAGALGCRPQALRFGVGEFGKPHLLSHANAPHFNVTHAGGEVLIAFSEEGALGLDLEFNTAAQDILEVAQAAFHPSELRLLQQTTNVADRRDLFLAIWTAREAVMKAAGCGLTRPPHFSVIGRTLPLLAASVEVSFSETRRGCSFFLYPLAVGAGRTASLATEQLVNRVRVRTLWQLGESSGDGPNGLVRPGNAASVTKWSQHGDPWGIEAGVHRAYAQ